MELIAWSSVYKVGIEKVDSQHQKLIQLINDLHALVTSGQDEPANTDGLLSELVSYTVYHFSEEEEMFQKHDYPSYLEHKQEHDDFVKEIKDAIATFQSGDGMTKEKLLVFLTQWLRKHILGSDKKYAPYLKEKGVV